MSLDPEVTTTAVAVGVTLARRRNHVVEGLRSELDLALEENVKLVKENQTLTDELHAARVKIGPEVLAAYAKQAIAYAEQMGGTNPEKLRHALEAARRLDEGDNGQRDWSDAQLRIAIEAAVKK
jgi:hypothetical protein